MKKIAFYGGSFDPIHIGHLAIADALTDVFALDYFFFVPAFHAPHKKEKRVTAAFCRYAMLALATNDAPKIKISTVELDAPEKPFTFETQTKLKNHFGKGVKIFFVIGADSWNEIDTWREWETVLTLTNIIVVTRPHYEIALSHVAPEIREKIIDLREAIQSSKFKIQNSKFKIPGSKSNNESRIYFTDAVFMDVSATEIRRKIGEKDAAWRENVAPAVAKYIEKYELYI